MHVKITIKTPLEFYISRFSLNIQKKDLCADISIINVLKSRDLLKCDRDIDKVIWKNVLICECLI